jgi:hypothetical protein
MVAGARGGAVAALGSQGDARVLLGRRRLGEKSSLGVVQGGCGARRAGAWPAPFYSRAAPPSCPRDEATPELNAVR